jgi:cytochrome P450
VKQPWARMSDVVAQAPYVDELGIWHLTRLRHIRRILNGERHGKLEASQGWQYFKRALGITSAGQPNDICRFPWFETLTDPDGSPGRWEDLHAVLVPHLGEEAAERLRPYVEQQARSLVRGSVEAQLHQDRQVGEIDLVAFTDRLAFDTVTELLSFPHTASNTDFIKAQLEDLASKEFPELFVPGPPELARYLKRIMDEHAAAGKGGLLGDIIAAPNITDAERHGLIIGCYEAGYRTTGITAALTLGSFEQHGLEQFVLAHLGSEGADARLAAESEARRIPPYDFNAIVAVEDLDIDGHLIKAGSLVFLHWEAAYNDPEEFSDPNTFDINRSGVTELGFGYGIHHCLGEPLAKVVVDVAVCLVFEMLQGWRMVSWNREVRGILSPVTEALAAFPLLPAARRLSLLA